MSPTAPGLGRAAGTTTGAARSSSDSEQLCAVLRGLHPQVLPAPFGGDSATWGTHEESQANQEGFGDLLDRLRLLPHADGKGRQPHRATVELAADGLQDGTVQTIQAQLVNLVEVQGGSSDLWGDGCLGMDVGVVTYPTQQSVGDTWCASGTAGDGRRGALGQVNPQHLGGPLDDVGQVTSVVVVELGREPEPVTQWPGQQSGPGRCPDEGEGWDVDGDGRCLLYTSPSPRD